MQPKSQRRVRGAEFKSQVLAECQEPGASVAAVARAHGLNVNLVRKWLVGRGIKRTRLPAPRTVIRMPPAAAEPTAASMQFIPVDLAPATTATDEAAAARARRLRRRYATRRLHAGSFVWCAREPGSAAPALQLGAQQFEALVLGLPWQRLREHSTIRRC